MRFEDWMRDKASDLLEIGGEAVEVTGDGTEVVFQPGPALFSTVVVVC
jgi:hypothetical protein